MLIIGCDYHPGFQQTACVDSETGEFQEQRLRHSLEAETLDTADIVRDACFRQLMRSLNLPPSP